MFGISSYSKLTCCEPPAALYCTDALLNENSWITGQASLSSPICPTGTFEFVLMPRSLRTTLFRSLDDKLPEHATKEESPFVNAVRPVFPGTANPSVSEKSTPNTEESVSPEQNTPKSSPIPPSPVFFMISSAFLAASTFAK